MSAETQDEDTAARNRRDGGCSFGIIKFDPSYVRDRWDGRLKLAEVIATFLAGVILPTTVYSYTGVFSFFNFVTWTSFINALIDLILHLFSLWDRTVNIFPLVCSAPEVFVILCGIACLAFLLASALVAGFAHYSVAATRAGVAAFFGFLCMVLFGAEAFFVHYIAFRRGRRDNVRQEEPDEFAEPI